MASYPGTWHGLSIRRPVFVVLAWVALVGAGFGLGVGVFDRLVPEVGQVPGSESERALEQLTAAAQQLRAVDAPVVAVAGGPLTGQEFNAQAQADVARAELLSPNPPSLADGCNRSLPTGRPRSLCKFSNGRGPGSRPLPEL